jgi:hypothetical protein
MNLKSLHGSRLCKCRLRQKTPRINAYILFFQFSRMGFFNFLTGKKATPPTAPLPAAGPAVQKPDTLKAGLLGRTFTRNINYVPIPSELAKDFEMNANPDRLRSGINKKRANNAKLGDKAFFVNTEFDYMDTLPMVNGKEGTNGPKQKTATLKARFYGRNSANAVKTYRNFKKTISNSKKAEFNTREKAFLSGLQTTSKAAAAAAAAKAAEDARAAAFAAAGRPLPGGPKPSTSATVSQPKTLNKPANTTAKAANVPKTSNAAKAANTTAKAANVPKTSNAAKAANTPAKAANVPKTSNAAKAANTTAKAANAPKAPTSLPRANSEPIPQVPQTPTAAYGSVSTPSAPSTQAAPAAPSTSSTSSTSSTAAAKAPTTPPSVPGAGTGLLGGGRVTLKRKASKKSKRKAL